MTLAIDWTLGIEYQPISPYFVFVYTASVNGRYWTSERRGRTHGTVASKPADHRSECVWQSPVCGPDVLIEAIFLSFSDCLLFPFPAIRLAVSLLSFEGRSNKEGLV